MLRSFFSGVSGMKGQQTKMDVIGNNIANATTTAFKASRVNFKDMLNSTISSATESSTSVGGTNPKQIGLGVSIASIDNDMKQGAPQPTGRSADLAIQGNGFFIVKIGTENYYTRDGGFTLDSNGYLVTSEGFNILDNNSNSIKIPPTNGSSEKLKSFSIEKDGKIRAIYAGTDTPTDIGYIGVATFNNPAGLEKSGSNLYKNTLNSGTADITKANEKGAGTIEQGFLEMSTVDLANEFTDMILTSRAFQANSKTITTSDEMLQELINLKR